MVINEANDQGEDDVHAELHIVLCFHFKFEYKYSTNRIRLIIQLSASEILRSSRADPLCPGQLPFLQ